MVYRVRVTRPARQDALEYATYIRDLGRSTEAAGRWLDGLEEATRSLAEFPERFPIIPEAGELRTNYRAFVYHSHRVVYEVCDSAGMVIVHRIYHTARRALDHQSFLDES